MFTEILVVGATTGCVPFVPGYMKAMREVCHRHGALFVLDEVSDRSSMMADSIDHVWLRSYRQTPLLGMGRLSPRRTSSRQRNQRRIFTFISSLDGSECRRCVSSWIRRFCEWIHLSILGYRLSCCLGMLQISKKAQSVSRHLSIIK